MALHKLTDASIRSAEKKARDPNAKDRKSILADGGGLHLRIRDNGSSTWFFVIRANGRRREMGLGVYPYVSLAEARTQAANARRAVKEGRDPIKERAAAKEPEASAEVVTFGKFAEDYIKSVEDGWRNEVHRQQWHSSLRDHAAALKNMPIADIATDDVLAVLQPIWLKKAETASRVRGRIEKILDAAKARNLRPRDAMNPASWRGHLALLLPKQPKLARGHHAALPYKEAPAFMVELRKRPALAARCLEFVILTAARSGEALGATWGEIDFAEKIWTVPAGRMKAGAEHVVPLSEAAITLLETLKPERPKPANLIFAVGGAARSNMAMAMLLRRMGRSDLTTHGFRSTLRDWAGDTTNFPRDLIEAALAHTIENKAERAYRRGTAIEQRRALMEAWAAYLSEAAGANVVPFSAAG
ncbi:integrase family protein [Hyphomicrobium denitrificans ATCC 51888]|uniref:Integrase family protein n=1 Tax=Hyphomicrobium denitrificans (strain ATCC 51888 / DSM 1869 / NCIMB 11706 / TK 0415) TaxID=582899 RepID=D8JT03_HYPDA|nr:integrase arm-type DNA-binding domain-containing protein [Hyphomicrobium denitrificans]ADJ22488.1 integrase family protein [Hyphomicrobium denitrificans ATCC 51888]